MIKAVLFDCDGVVIIGPMFSERYCEEFGISIDKMLPFFRNEFQLCLTGKSDLKIELKKYMGQWHWNKSVDELVEYWLKDDVVNQGLIQEIQKLRKQRIRCYLMTNQEKYRTGYLSKTLGFSHLFDDIFSSAYIGYTKPSVQFFKEIFKRIRRKLKNLKKHEVLLFDDETKNVKSVKEFGFNAKQYKDFSEFQKIINKYLRIPKFSIINN